MNLKENYEKKILFFLLIGFFIFFFCLSYFAEATYDSGDGIRHYLVSRYCWHHSDLLLYSWGKPFFSIISSPFSQFGLLGINVFNILCGIGSAFFAYKIAKQLKLNYALLIVPFLLFTPIYFPTLNSGLTEPFFGFILITSIYLMFKEKYLWACILISFLPFIRTEGDLVLPLFFIILIYRKKILISPLLAFGTIVYSIIGLFYFHDFFWIINQNPYNGANRAFYGSGPLLYFVKGYNYIWGSALTLLLVAGLVAVVYGGFLSLKSKALRASKLPEEFFLIYGSFAIYFVAHSIMWWKGLANSLGLIRVLAAVIPCTALVCLRGFNYVMIPFFRRKMILEIIIVTFLVLWVMRSPFKHDYFPYKLDPEQALIKESSDWFKKSEFTKQKIYYIFPVFAHFLNIDPFNDKRVGELWGLYPSIKEWGIDVIPDSTIIFWDAHFGPNECRIPKDTIMNDPHFELIKAFKPQNEFTTLGGYKFEVFAFMKIKQPKKLETLAVDFFDFEKNNPILDKSETIVSDKAFSGKNASKLSSQNEFSAIVKKQISEFPKNTLKVDIDCKIADVAENSKDALFVFSIDDEKGKSLLWSGAPLILKPIDKNKIWRSAMAEFVLSLDLYPPNAVAKIYVWNKAKKEFYLDDFKITYIGKE